MGIERLDIPSSVDRYNNYLSSTVNKSELDLIVPTPNTIKLLGGELPLKSKYSINIDESLNLDSNLIVSLLDEVTEIDIKENDSINDIYVNYVDDLNEESYILNINQDKILISARVLSQNGDKQIHKEIISSFESIQKDIRNLSLEFISMGADELILT